MKFPAGTPRLSAPRRLLIGTIAGLLAFGSQVPLASASTTTTLTFATFNVCKGGQDGTTQACSPPAPSWSIRRDRIARTVLESGVDVIGIQEATANVPAGSNAPTQWQDINAILSPDFSPPTFDDSSNECKRLRDPQGELMRDSEGVRLPSPCENTARLLFRSSTVEQAATGNGTPSAGITTLGGVQNTANGELKEFPGITTGLTPESAKRSVAWAYLRPRDGGTPFLAVSLHTDNTKDAAHELDRVAIARALGAWTEAMNSVHDMVGAPVVLMADLNSFAKRQPQGAQRVLVDTGWVDSFTAPFKKNIRYSTINYSATRVTEAQGFPTRPALTKRTKANPTGAATRIDYIFVKGASVRPVSYEVVIRLDSKGAFVTDYQGSDHQMVKAIVTFQ